MVVSTRRCAYSTPTSDAYTSSRTNQELLNRAEARVPGLVLGGRDQAAPPSMNRPACQTATPASFHVLTSRRKASVGDSFWLLLMAVSRSLLGMLWL
jgi:hypothetical protein